MNTREIRYIEPDFNALIDEQIPCENVDLLTLAGHTILISTGGQHDREVHRLGQGLGHGRFGR